MLLREIQAQEVSENFVPVAEMVFRDVTAGLVVAVEATVLVVAAVHNGALLMLAEEAVAVPEDKVVALPTMVEMVPVYMVAAVVQPILPPANWEGIWRCPAMVILPPTAAFLSVAAVAAMEMGPKKQEAEAEVLEAVPYYSMLLILYP